MPAKIDRRNILKTAGMSAFLTAFAGKLALHSPESFARAASATGKSLSRPLKRAAVVYFSRSGHTRRVAEAIAATTGAPLFEIRLKTPYSDDYKTAAAQVKADIERADPMESALASIGSINTPMAMMIIGASLAHSDIRAAFTNPRLYRVTFLRLIVMPLVFIGLALVVPINRMLAGMCVIVAAMPIAGNCSMLSDIYTPDDMTASHATIVSTLISGVTLPLLVLVMSMVGLG